MLAYLNYGFPTFFPGTGSVSDELLHLFDEVTYPVWRDVRYEIGSNAYGLLPLGLPTLFKGSRMYLTGRFKTPGTSTLSMAGFTASGATFLDLPLTFPSTKTPNEFAEKFWAKEKIDDIERTIAVYGANDSLKQAVIKLSLGYGIRCMYTAYIADKNAIGSTGVEDRLMLTSISAVHVSSGILINWKSSAPSKVRRVDIYRKSFSDVAFRLIASVEGTNTTYLDFSPSDGRVSYLIELVGIDGQSIRSRIFSPDEGMVPTFCVLEQNFPNPFNPGTDIRFDLAASARTTIKLYDAAGREIATLTDRFLDAGRHMIHFDASSLPSGLYIYRLTSGSFTASRKMLLLK
jgi:hypothetical protein